MAKNEKNEKTELQEVDRTTDIDFSAGQGSSGFEGTDSSTFKTPFLKILQALSPELKKSDPKSIPGAEQGQFCNTATGQVYDSLNVVVLKVEHSVIAWQPDRGGFVGRYPKSMEDKIVSRSEGLEKWDEDGNELVDTIEFFCMNTDNPADIFILSISKASIKHAKSWATKLRMLTANGTPVKVSWAGVWNISTVEEKNDKGSWFTIGATPKFQRFITSEEKRSFVDPARQLLETAEVEYQSNPSAEHGSATEEEAVKY